MSPLTLAEIQDDRVYQSAASSQGPIYRSVKGSVSPCKSTKFYRICSMNGPFGTFVVQLQDFSNV